jgi:signal transduction histidine kinase
LPRALGVLKNLGSGYLRADDVSRNGTFGTNLFTGCLPTNVVNHVDKRIMPHRNTRYDGAWIGTRLIRRGLVRLSLPVKILLATSCVVTVLSGITLSIVLGNINRSLPGSLKEKEEVRDSYRTCESVLQVRQELMRSAGRVVSEMKEARPAIGTGGNAAIEAGARELWAKVSRPDAIYPITDPNGKLLASPGGVTSLPPALRDATGRDFLFDNNFGKIAFPPNPRAATVTRAILVNTKDAGMLSYGKHKYSWSRQQQLQDISRNKAAEECIVRSFEDDERRIADLSTSILRLWLGSMCAGLGLSYLLARRILEPVKQLDRAATEVARQNYTIQVGARGEDEIGRLAQTFNTMCASIRHAREELVRQERISTIGRLSSSIVHDLRNPLAAIYGGAEMLVDGNLPPAHVKRLAANIYDASRRIEEMLQDLLNVSRGKSSAPEPCRLGEVVAAACESLAATAESRGVTLRVEIAPEIELPLVRSRIERAFVNLVGNAIEAMPKGGEVRIWAKFDMGSVVAHVDDTGPGVAVEIRSQLFQPFVTAGKRNGLGLGLALTRQTVLEHGGDLWVDNAPCGGARFSLRLPGARVVEPPAQVARVNVAVGEQSVSGKRAAAATAVRDVLMSA